MPNTTTLEEKGQQLHNYHQTIMFRVLMMASLASFAEPKGNCRFSVGSRWMSLVESRFIGICCSSGLRPKFLGLICTLKHNSNILKQLRPGCKFISWGKLLVERQFNSPPQLTQILCWFWRLWHCLSAVETIGFGRTSWLKRGESVQKKHGLQFVKSRFPVDFPRPVRKQNSQHWNTGQHRTLLTFKHDIPLQNNSLARGKKHTFVWTERTRQFPDASSCSVLFTGFYR